MTTLQKVVYRGLGFLWMGVAGFFALSMAGAVVEGAPATVTIGCLGAMGLFGHMSFMYFKWEG